MNRFLTANEDIVEQIEEVDPIKIENDHKEARIPNNYDAVV